MCMFLRTSGPVVPLQRPPEEIRQGTVESGGCNNFSGFISSCKADLKSGMQPSSAQI